jgi:hypothetical protein
MAKSKIMVNCMLVIPRYLRFFVDLIPMIILLNTLKACLILYYFFYLGNSHKSPIL